MSLQARSLVLVLAALACSAPAAQAQTFSNTAAITMPTSDTDGRGSLYPSPIAVSGVPGTIGFVSVTLNRLAHNWMNDLNVLLVSPTGQRVLLLANANGSAGALNTTFTFIPDGTAFLPVNSVPVLSGVYGCSVYNPGDLLAPAPPGPYSTNLSSLIGTAPNGTWNLYVWDDVPVVDDGALVEGWSIAFSSAPAPLPTAFTYQGVLSASGSPINGDANVRFTLCNSADAPLLACAVASPVTRALTGITDGRVSTTVDFGAAIDVGQARWLNIEVESPPGSGFVNLSPRQSVTPAPQARVAQVALNTLNANTAGTAAQLGPGRQRIRSDAGSSPNSPGIWFASPVSAPIDRAFVGQRDDNNVGFFNGGWNFLLNNNGNTALGDPSGSPPPERLTVNGSVQINTGPVATPNRLAFGLIGDEVNTAENSDAVYFQRVNTGQDTTELRLIIGDNFSAIGTDSLRICTTSVGGSLFERMRFQSDGQALKPGGGSWAALSDPRAKHDIAPLAGTLDRLLALRGYSFLYNDDRVAQGLARPGPQIGLMADEVARVFPDWVSADTDGTRYVTERATTALMVEALRDLRAEKDAVAAKARADAAAAQMQIDALNARLRALEERLAKP